MKKSILLIAIICVTSALKIFAQSDAKQTFGNILTAYLDLKNSFVKDNSDSARAAGKKLFDAIHDVPMEKLTADNHKVWMEYYEKLSYDAEHIKSTDDIDHQRGHFAKLSIHLHDMLKKMKVNTTDLFYQFCPMANDGKGAYWLSETKEIHNPYMGKKMPTCGSTKETISAAN